MVNWTEVSSPQADDRVGNYRILVIETWEFILFSSKYHYEIFKYYMETNHKATFAAR